MTLLERVTEAKRSGDYHALLEAVPYAGFLGLSARLEGDELITTMRFADHLIGNPALPALHGGTLGALLESAAIFELLWRAEAPDRTEAGGAGDRGSRPGCRAERGISGAIVLPKTITITVDYLRSGAARDTHARGTVTRHGRRVANVRVEAWQADRAAPVATAHAIFLVTRDA